MSTIKQIAANRLNALLSTGPRSAEGKAISSLNALRSGIDAKSDLIRGEDSAALETLTAEYRDRFLPTNPEERLLVDILVHDDWLLRRFRRVDAEIFECEMQDAWTPKNDCPAGQAFGRGADTFSRLQRRIDATERSYRRSLEFLRFLQHNPDPPLAPDPRPEAPDPSPMPSVPQPQIGFVPQPSSPDPWPPAPDPASQASLKPPERTPGTAPRMPPTGRRAHGCDPLQPVRRAASAKAAAG